MKNIHRVFTLLVVSVIWTLAIAACSTTGASFALTPAMTPTSSSQAQATPTTQPTTATQATSTSAPTSAPAATRTSAPSTSAPVGPITVATVATNEDAPGNAAKVYVSAIRANPAQPVSAGYVTFYGTFVNNSGASQALKWYVKIWSPSNTNQSFGETAKQINDIPAGTSVIASASNWRTNPINCESFTARVYWLNSSVNFGNPVEFTKPDGSAGVQQNFQVCEPTKTP